MLDYEDYFWGTIMDLDVLCPECEDSVMVEEGDKRVCKECEFEMSGMEYQIFLAQRFAYVDSIITIPNAIERRSFGRKKSRKTQ